jgi:hypothetical protein
MENVLISQNILCRLNKNTLHLMGKFLGPNNLEVLHGISWSRDSAVGIATGYGLDDQGVGVRVLVG